MTSRYNRGPVQFGLGGGGAPPRDILAILIVLFVTFSATQLGASGLGYLCLSTDALFTGSLWQFATYAFVASPTSSGIWFLLELLIIFWFGRDVYRALGRRGFWTVVGWAIGAAAVTASAVHGLLALVGLQPGLPLLGMLGLEPAGSAFFVILQGEHILLTILIAAFATLYGNATIYLMFILPVRARWFLGIEILFAFMSFLSTHDFGGFAGVCAAVGVTYSMLVHGGYKRMFGNLRASLRELRLRLERKVLEARIRRLRKKRGLHVVREEDFYDDGKPPGRDRDGEDNVRRGPWVN